MKFGITYTFVIGLSFFGMSDIAVACTGGANTNDISCGSLSDLETSAAQWASDVFDQSLAQFRSQFASTYSSEFNYVDINAYAGVSRSWGHENVAGSITRYGSNFEQSFFNRRFGPGNSDWTLDHNLYSFPYQNATSDFTLGGLISSAAAGDQFVSFGMQSWISNLTKVVSADSVTYYAELFNYAGLYAKACGDDACSTLERNNSIDALVWETKTVSLGTFSTVSVPGPEAGAGLAGLAMAGIGAYAIRRRKQIAA